MNKIYEELKYAEVKHIKYGKGIIKNVEMKEYECNYDIICTIAFNNDSKECRKFKLIASNIEDKLEILNINIKKYIDYLKTLNVEKEIEYIKKERYNFLKNREIEYLVHFTNIENLLSIMENGLLSVNQLNKKNITFFYSDKDRLDNQLDYVSTSISFPNYKMFYRKRIENKDSRWIILKISSQSIIDKLDSIFLPTNSADKIMQINLLENREYYNTNKALEKLFDTKVNYRGKIKYRQDYLININMTTNPQAEILICDKVDTKYIDAIIVGNEETKKIVRDILYNNHIEIEIRPDLFEYRKDFENWRN